MPVRQQDRAGIPIQGPPGPAGPGAGAVTLDAILPPVAAVNLAGQRLLDVADPILGTDGISKSYADSNYASASRTLNQVPAPTTDVTFAGHKAVLLADPTNAQDAATKNYTDSSFVHQDGTGMPVSVVQAIQPAAVPDGVTDNHSALQASLSSLTDGKMWRLPPGSFVSSASLVIAPPANATVTLRFDGTIKKTASFSDTGISSGGVVIDGSAGGVTVYLEAPAHKLVIDGNQAAGATAVGLRIKGGATVVMRGGKYNNNNATGVFCTDANTDVRCYDVEASGNIGGSNGIGFVATAGAKLRTYGDCIADGNEVAGFRFNNTAAAGCVLNGRARNNVTATGTGGTGASLRSYGGRVGRFSASGPGTADGNGNGGLAVEFGGDNWDLGDLELFNGGNPNGAQSNNSGFGLALFGATRCKLSSAVLGMNSGYHVVLGRVSSPLSTAVSNAGAGITNSATTIPCAGGNLPTVWPVQGVLLIKDAFTVDITAGSRQLTIDTGPTGAIPVPGASVDGIPAIATFTGDIANGSPTVNNVSSFAGIVDGQYYNATGVPNGTKILSHNVGANTITLDTPATTTTVGVASTVSTLPQTGTYVIPFGSSTLHFLTNHVPAVGGASVAVTMGAELVIYRGVSGGSFTSCQRGMFGSVAAAHPDAAVVIQNPSSHHNQLGIIIGDSTGNWDKDPGVAISGGSTHNTIATVDMTSVPAALSFGEGAAGNDHNIIENLIAHNCTLEIVQCSGGSNNRIDRISARDCAAAGGGGGYLLNHDATNWPVHDNVVGNLAHKVDSAAAPTGNIRNINGAVGNYIEGKLGDQLNAPIGRRYGYTKSRVPQNQTNALVSGTVYAFGGEDAIIPAGKTVTAISLWAGTTAAAGITHLWYGLVDRRNETTAGTATTDLPNSGILAVTADTPLGTGANAWTANTELNIPLAVAFRPQDDMPYAVVFCCVATTMPTLAGVAIGNLIANIGNESPKMSVSTGLTGRTVPLAIGSNLSAESTFGNLPYHEIVVS